eukprot:XP_015581850.1 FGGY carbohydrate kinase domain-containing protein-like isoform X1 [Ricinus communis]
MELFYGASYCESYTIHICYCIRYTPNCGALECSWSQKHDNETICHRMALVCGTSTCHMVVSQSKLFISGVWEPFWSAVIPKYWFTEGGQSATGALLDYIMENHAASRCLANCAASQNISLFELLNNKLRTIIDDIKAPFLAALTQDVHVLPNFHGNRSPATAPKTKGIICGMTLDTSDRQLAVLYLAAVQGIAYGTCYIVEHCNAHGHTVGKHPFQSSCTFFLFLQ